MTTARKSRARFPDAVNEILGDGLCGALGAAFTMIEWAEEEIEAACKRHPGKADLLWHSGLNFLCPLDDVRMQTEFVYRAHARELLERLAVGDDTRPGTTVEVVIACSRASALAPLNETATGLAARMWIQAFPDKAHIWGDRSSHYEYLNSSAIDALEREARHKTRNDQRRIREKDIACGGLHHGKQVACKYARAEQLALV